MSDLTIRLGERALVARLSPDGRVHVDETTYTVDPVGSGMYRVSDGTRRWMVAVAGPADDRWVFVDGQAARVEVSVAGGRVGRKGRSTAHDLSSPMPATVLRVLVEVGTRVKRGDTLLTLEAMKMELPIRAPRDGVVLAVHCRPGELVQPGLNLLELE